MAANPNPSNVFPISSIPRPAGDAAISGDVVKAGQLGLNKLSAQDVAIKTLGECLLPSPVAETLGESALAFVGRADKVLVNDHLSDVGAETDASRLPAFELAGPRNRIFFDPRRVRCGVVTCGGLCPGINNVVRGLVFELARGYGVKQMLGFRFGYEGLISRLGHAPMVLTQESVAGIHRYGGTVLGSSRGSQDPAEVVDNLEALGIDVLFVVGGDGTIRGAMRISEELARRKLKTSVVGIPKTIDNDIQFIDRSFGFESAFSAAVEVIRAAHVEATGARNGIGLVKLMGRHSGFVACQAALASTDVDMVLIPEIPWRLDGDRGVARYLDRVLEKKGHAVVVVAEGAGQDILGGETPSGRTDKSGNARLEDIGVYLRDNLPAHLQRMNREVTLKYIDPSYSIRSVAASPSDSVYCWNMARNAVHAAMAGNTEMLIGRWHGRFVHVPMPLATRMRKEVEATEDLWMSVVEATGQPRAWQ